MTTRRSLCVAVLLLSGGWPSLTEAEIAPASDVVREMNVARQQPAQYAAYLEERRATYRGKEGNRALEDAIRFLRSASPRQPLALSHGMSRAAADHCADQAGGGMSHRGRGGSSTGDRLNRYGRWSGRWGENLSCGRSSAREIVLALIVDDGLSSRKHRANIFNPEFNYAGAAMGSHAQYRTICSMEFAGQYAERGQSASEPLMARN